MSVFTHLSGKMITRNNASIYFEEVGNDDGIPLLLLHGGFGTLEDFESLAAGLMSDFRMIAVDARGQGKSTLGDGALTYQAIREDVIALLDHLKITKINVAGFSDGGMVAQLLAIHNADRIEKLISIGAPWQKQDLELIRGFLEKVTPQSWEEKFPDSYHLYRSLNPSVDFEILVNQLKKMWLDESASGGYPGELVKKIKAETLIIRGDEDHLFSRESAAKLADHIEHSKLLNIPFGGHEVHKDQAEMVREFIVKFIKD